MDKLKPCPFCGGQASIKHYESKKLFRKNIQYSYVQCNACNARTEIAYTDAEVSYKWNRRAEDGK